MKKTVIVLLALLVLPATLWAMDITQGKFELSGKTAFDFSDTTTEVSGQPDIDTTTWSFQLDGNYYIMNNLGLGLILQYEKTKIEQGGSDTDISSLLIGPQVMSIESRVWARKSRSEIAPVLRRNWSARVLFPWSMWATIEKLRMYLGSVISTNGG